MYTENGSYKQRWRGVAILSFALLIIAIDNTVLNVALPAISLDLDSNASDLQWIVDIYILFFSSLLLTFGAISDRYGRKMMLNIGMVIFGLGSLGAALANSSELLIFMRGVTGIGGAAMMPATLAILADMFRDPQERQKAIMYWSMTFGIGFGVGPILGGWIIDHYSWELVFYLNVPVVILGLLFSKFYLPESKDTNATKEDLKGMGLSIVALFSLVYAIINAGAQGLSDLFVIVALVVGIVLFTLFIRYEMRCDHAMLPLALLKNQSFLVASIAITLVMFGMMGTMYFLSQYLQTVQEYSALEVGLLLLPLTGAMTLSSALAPALTAKYGMRFVVTLGIAISAIGMLIFALMLDTSTSLAIIVLGFVVQGFGIGFAMVPATDSIMGSIPQSKLGVGSAMNDSARELGGALSVAVMGAMMNSVYIESMQGLNAHTLLSAVPTEFKDLITGSIQGAHAVANSIANVVLSSTIIEKADSAFIDGMHNALIFGTIVTFLAAIYTLFKLPNTITVTKEEEL